MGPKKKVYSYCGDFPYRNCSWRFSCQVKVHYQEKDLTHRWATKKRLHLSVSFWFRGFSCVPVGLREEQGVPGSRDNSPLL